MDLSYSQWCFERRVRDILRGWVFYSFDPNNRGLIHPERDCENSSCPQHGTVHRHVPTLADREEAYDYITAWLELEYEREGERKDITELKRMFALEDPRPLPDIALFLERMTREQRDFWELNHLYLLEDPRPSSPVLPPTNESDSPKAVEPPLVGVENWLSKNTSTPKPK